MGLKDAFKKVPKIEEPKVVKELALLVHRDMKMSLTDDGRQVFTLTLEAPVDNDGLQTILNCVQVDGSLRVGVYPRG